MKPPPISSKLPLLLHVLVHLAWLPPPSLSDQRYANCAPMAYRCGDVSINVSYPFRVDGRNDYCGHIDYFLICTDNSSLTIKIAADIYRVKAVDYSNHFISLVDTFLLAGASAGDDCSVPRANMTVDFSLYDYSERDVNLTFYANCSAPPATNALHRVDCPAAAGGEAYYSFDAASSGGRPANCSVTTFAAVEQAAVNSLGSGKLELSDALRGGFSLKWMAGKGWCSNCTLSGGRCGYNIASPADHTCICPEGLVIGKCSSETKSSKKKIRKGIGVGAGVAASLAMCCALLLYWFRRRRQSSLSLLLRADSSEPSSKKDPELGSAYYQTQTFSYKELDEATDSFSASKELGDGGFGTVYKGKLRDGRTVAVKRLYENNYKRVEQFMNEIVILSRLRHQNLVTLYGCSSRHSRELLLVYEFVPNGTVADHLHGPLAAEGALTWPVRMNIAIETADALAYLHAIEPQIIHRDVKTNNILLDSNFHVKVADFGLSRLFPVDATHVSTAPQGTPGYVDPEYHQCYQLTDKSDVYSFGVVLVELISSMPAVDISRHRHEINLSNMAINKIQNRELDQLIDPALGYQSDCQVKCMITQVAELAFRCLQAERDMRPAIKEALEVLRAIESSGRVAENAAETDANTTNTNDTPLFKDTIPFSPDTVTDKWASRATTPNTSS